jgi:uncharacterized protein
VLAQSRQAPDQYELVRQVQSECDKAKYAAAYLSSQQAPSHPDTEKTIGELRADPNLCEVPAERRGAGLHRAAERRVAPACLQEKWMRGDTYLAEVAIPNFYFHVTTAYAILRHNGVELGKFDFSIGSLPVNAG